MLVGLLALWADWTRVSFALALAGFGAAGGSAGQLFERRFPKTHVKNLEELGAGLSDPVHPLWLTGRIVSTPLRTSYHLQFDVEARSAEIMERSHAVTGKVRLRLRSPTNPALMAIADSLHLQQGDSIRAAVQLERPRSYRNPGSFDFRRWMESIEDIYWLGTIKSPLLIERFAEPGKAGPWGLIERTRQHLLRSIDLLDPPWSAEGRNGAVLKAVLLGDRSSLDSDTIESFRRTGLYHLLVIAGLHVGLIAMLLGNLFRLLRLREPARTALLLVFLLGYASLVEQRAPTLRATLMILTLLVARLLDREYAGLNSIGLAAILLLVYRPAWLFESGFQLSFSAALLIAGLAVPILERTTEPYRHALFELQNVARDVALKPHQAQFRLDLRSLTKGLMKRVSSLGKNPRLASALVTGPTRAVLWTANIVLFSAILQVGLLLPMVETFHRVSLAGIGLNALAIPVMTLLLALAVPTVILCGIAPAIALWPGKALGVVMSGLFHLTDLPGMPTWLSYQVPAPPGWVAFGFILSSVVAAWALTGGGRWLLRSAVASFGIFAAFVALHPFPQRLPSGVLEATALDCGPSETVFVTLPDRTTLLWMGGGWRGGSTRSRGAAFQVRRWDPGENIIAPYLWSRGIKKIDILGVASLEERGLDELMSITRAFRVEELWYGATPWTADTAAFLERVQGKTRIRQRVAGEEIRRGTTSIQILWPPSQAEPMRTLRENSLVVRIAHGPASILLVGNVGRKAEEALAGSSLPLESQVLAVLAGPLRGGWPHSELMARLSPRLLLVTGESDRSTRLPLLESVEYLRTASPQIRSTEIEGAVTVRLAGSAFAVHSYRESPTESWGEREGTVARGDRVPSVR